MKLLLVSDELTNRQSGVARILLRLGEQLERRGHTVHYFFSEEQPRRWLPDVPDVERAMRLAPFLSRYCRQERYEIIFTTTTLGWCLSTFRKQLLPPDTKLVCWHHGWEGLKFQQMQQEEREKTLSFPVREKVASGLQQWASIQTLKTQDACFVTSTEEYQWIQRQHPQQGHKVIYLPNGVDALYYHPERFAIPAPVPASRLLFVGVWNTWRKGKRILIPAFSRLKARYPHLQLSLVGTQCLTSQVISAFPEAVRADLHVVPTTDEMQMSDIYRQHDIFILPSLFEGMPLTVLEAMASALPVITTQNNGMRDVIEHYENGLLIPRRDVNALVQSVSHLLDSPELCRKLGENAYETVSRCYTWPQVTDIFEENLFRIRHNQLQIPKPVYEPIDA